MTISLRLISLLLAFTLSFLLLKPWPAPARGGAAFFRSAQPAHAASLQTVARTDSRMTAATPAGNCATPPAQSNFAATEARAYQWTLVSGARVGDTVSWDFRQPNGSSYLLSDPLTISGDGNRCFWWSINIAGAPAASLPGNWQVRVIYNGALFFTENFTIGSGGGVNCPLTPINFGETKTGALSTSDCLSPIDGPGFFRGLL